jgi:hypothetical protein
MTLADYTPLIERAVEGLERNTGENRRELYERARKALLAQLRSIDPPLDESEITRERLALEDAIRAVETDAGKRSRDQGPEDEQGGHDEFLEPPPAPKRSLSDQGLAGFRENVAEAEGLGEAAAHANESARRVFPPEPESEPEPDHADFPPARDEVSEPPEPESQDRGWQAPPASHQYDDDDEGESYRKPRRSYGRLIAVVVAVLVLAGIGAAGYWQRETVVSVAHKAVGMVTAWRSSSPAPTKPRQTTPSQQPKITDRVGQPATPSRPANAPAADVAQKVVLYEEDPGNKEGKRYVGSAIWRTETVSPGPGLAPELAVRCDVEIPERRLRMTWSLRRNTDKALPASHTIEIMFTLPADFSEGGIQNVPGMLMKQNEQARGVPLAGLAVKVTNGFFLVGLNSSEADVQRNIALLKERPWFDIPIVYNNNKRAILAVEKGIPGERAFADAFKAWGQ